VGEFGGRFVEEGFYVRIVYFCGEGGGVQWTRFWWGKRYFVVDGVHAFAASIMGMSTQVNVFLYIDEKGVI
jgi:hypothetical protein